MASHRRRHGHRGGGRQDPEKIFTGHRSPVGLHAFQGRKIALPRARQAISGKHAASSSPALYKAFVDDRLLAGRDQPAGRRPSDGEVLALDAQVQLRRQRRSSGTTRSPSMRDLDEEDPNEVEATSATSPTSRSTATSAAWSTAPASPWPPWTSSSIYGGNPANFLDVGGGATTEQVTAASRSSSPTRTSKASSSTSSAAS